MRERCRGVDKKMHQRRGVQAEAGAEGQARQRGAGERRQSRPHTASPMGLRKCIGGEEVAATFGDTEDLSPRALCLCRYAPPATYSHALPAFYLSVKKNVGTKRRPQDVRFTELLIGGKKESLNQL